MGETPTKAELLARLRAERATWESAFGTLTREQLLLPDAVGFWSTKDVQDHITSNNRWMAVQLRALVRDELPTAEDAYGHTQTPPPGTDLADQDQRNAWWYSIDCERPLDETLIAAPLWAAALAEAIAAVPAEEMARGYTFGGHLHIGQVRPATTGEPAWSLGSIIASYADEHYHNHNADIRAAQERGHYGA
jgi:hypothetical protein